ncbi:MAG: hypothetical protein KBD16_03780 [Candidatus Pacebacteria bacterium]|nr:hypothetical protein [Candidatus Paceibacterota bacterium]
MGVTFPLFKQYFKRRGHYKRLFLPAFAAALIAMEIKALLIIFGLQINEHDAEILREPLIGFGGALYSILAALIGTRVWGERQEVLRTVRENKWSQFRIVIQDRIPHDLRTLLLVMALIVILSIEILPFQSPFVGVCAVGSVALLFGLYWSVAMFLDNPLEDPDVQQEIARTRPRWLKKIKVLRQQANDGR